MDKGFFRYHIYFLAMGLGLCWSILIYAAEPGSEKALVAPPMPWQESAPPARMFLQLPFEMPEPVEERNLQSEVRLLYSNSILVGSTPALAVDVDIESAEILSLFRYGFAAGFELQLAVPVIVDYGGFLDGPIEGVEGLFGASAMAHRNDRPRNLARFRITRPDNTGLWNDGAGVSLGDAWAGLKILVVKQDGALPAMALRAAVKLPTGRLSYGSGTVDLGGSLMIGWTWRRVNLWIEVDAATPTADFDVARISTRAYGAAQLGLVVPLCDMFAINIQWSSHISPFARTGIPQLDAPVHYLLLGVSMQLTRSLLLEAAAVENIFSPASGVDFAMLFGLRIQTEKP
jgi:hypothetical protein